VNKQWQAAGSRIQYQNKIVMIACMPCNCQENKVRFNGHGLDGKLKFIRPMSFECPGGLLQCEICGSLWVSIPYEPMMSFVHLVRWDAELDKFKEEYFTDIYQWHGAVLLSHYKKCGKELIVGVLDWKNPNPPESYFNA
jgi:hypothetical protein